MPDESDKGATRDLNPPDQGGSESGLRPIYEQSWAVFVGVNDYPHSRKLRYAVADAEGVAELLIREFEFGEDKAFLLRNEQATRGALYHLGRVLLERWKDLGDL